MAIPYHLYRHLDSEGRVLYIGLTRYLRERQVGHRSKPWIPEVAKVVYEVIYGRSEAYRAERAAIAAENPVHNKRRHGSCASQQPARYPLAFGDTSHSAPQCSKNVYLDALIDNTVALFKAWRPQ